MRKTPLFDSFWPRKMPPIVVSPKLKTMDAVYFLEHETDELDYVAGSFEDFLDGIVKANYDDLPSVKNAEVWIDPEFLKLQKDLGNA
ncbi:hypothetical protein N9491_07120 [Planktomarina temperata]|nr:hypothetical protein [Planktomarina temperata]